MSRITPAEHAKHIEQNAREWRPRKRWLRRPEPIKRQVSAFRSASDSLIIAALIRWASDVGDPRPNFVKAVSDSEQALRIASESAEQLEVWRHANWGLSAFCQLLLYPTNHPPLLDAARPPVWLDDLEDWWLFTLWTDYLLLDALRRGRFTPEWDALIEIGEGYQKLHEPTQAYLNYWNLIEAWKAGEGEQVLEVVRECEQHFDARPRMKFYIDEGDGTDGSWEQPPMVDFRLAAILKVLEAFGGAEAPQIQTRHRWRW